MKSINDVLYSTRLSDICNLVVVDGNIIKNRNNDLNNNDCLNLYTSDGIRSILKENRYMKGVLIQEGREQIIYTTSMYRAMFEKEIDDIEHMMGINYNGGNINIVSFNLD
ncbi:hypothetical protein [Mediterraneibacter gnavus]|uniref:hypothetical protein n=1 Tax=Mediterraneibacter gnavus TaxID=33038 RepID=UPI0019251516|nr:hypothetical protein [Mediterraneibacter gnavus]